MKFFKFIIVFSVSSLIASQAWAVTFKPNTYSSNVVQTPLIELYTSEGCHSCPPADEWLSGLKQQANLWQDFVPISFHVDYWDYIGWKDRFADNKYTQRQRLYAVEFKERTVYTPGMRIMGQEWRKWYRAKKSFMTHINTQLQAPDIGSLTLVIEENNAFSAKLDAIAPLGIKSEQDYLLNVAILGMDLSTEVKRGENRGKTLDHDFVVLGMQSFPLSKEQWQGQLPEIDIKAPQYAVVAWIAEKSSLVPKQAVGGYLAHF